MTTWSRRLPHVSIVVAGIVDRQSAAGCEIAVHLQKIVEAAADHVRSAEVEHQIHCAFSVSDPVVSTPTPLVPGATVPVAATFTTPLTTPEPPRVPPMGGRISNAPLQQLCRGKRRGPRMLSAAREMLVQVGHVGRSPPSRAVR